MSLSLEIKPFEFCNLYEGMEILEPTPDIPLRRYTPKIIEQTSSYPSPENNIKPGFYEQAIEIKNILKGSDPKISASLSDAYNSQLLVQNILYC